MLRKIFSGFIQGSALVAMLPSSIMAANVPTSAIMQNNLPQVTVTPTNTLPPCTYYASDTYVGTTNQSGYGPGPYSTETDGAGISGMGGSFISMPSPPMTDNNNNLNLGFRGGAWTSTSWAFASWNGGTASPLNTPVQCTGTYQVYFTLQLQATNYNGGTAGYPPPAAPTINVRLCDTTTDGATIIWGAATTPSHICPTSVAPFKFNPVCNGGNYCSVMTFPFITQVHLTAGQVVGPPTITTDNQVNVTGGEFTVYYLGP